MAATSLSDVACKILHRRTAPRTWVRCWAASRHPVFADSTAVHRCAFGSTGTDRRCTHRPDAPTVGNTFPCFALSGTASPDKTLDCGAQVVHSSGGIAGWSCRGHPTDCIAAALQTCFCTVHTSLDRLFYCYYYLLA